MFRNHRTQQAMNDLKKLGEFGFIGNIQKQLKARSPHVLTGIGDDCAVLSPSGKKQLIVTTDALIEGVHFDLAWTSPSALGEKAIAVNVSDISAMGGEPTAALISLGIPAKLPLKFLQQFYKGIDSACKQYNIELCGGDTVASKKDLFINIVLLGQTNASRTFYRTGAQTGDLIYVTGTLGDSALGLKLLKSRRKKWNAKESDLKFLIKKHLQPTARLKESRVLALSALKITAMIDVSDGLVQDLHHICQSSKVGAVLNLQSLPRSKAFQRVSSFNKLNANELAFHGGEDYELVFTLPPQDAKKMEKLFQKSQISLIGEILPTPDSIFIKEADGKLKPVKKLQGYQHF